jgi:hypothetical protein
LGGLQLVTFLAKNKKSRTISIPASASLIENTKYDDLVKSLKRRISVIPANPGSGPGQAPESSYFKYFKILWTPVFTGVTTFYENINFHFAIGNAFMIMFSDLERWRKS